MGNNTKRCNGEDDDCCTSSDRCNIGEGDCDFDSDCSENLFCGMNNCVGDTFDIDDDCCTNRSDYTQCSGKIENDFWEYSPEWLSLKFNPSHECAKFRLPVCSEPDHFLKVHFLHMYLLINLYSSHCY